MWKKLLFPGLFYKGVCFSQKSRSLISDTLTHTSDVFFARPVVVIGISGLVGGTLGYYFDFLPALCLFVLLHVFLVICQLILIRDSSELHIRAVLMILALLLGVYCLSFISLERYRAYTALESAYLDAEESAKSGNESVYEGYIISISLPDEDYKTYTLLWKDGVKVRFGSKRADLAFGLHVRVAGILSDVPSARNPGGFDQRSYYGRQGIYLNIDTYDENIFIQQDSSLAPDLFIKLEIMGLTLRSNISTMWEQVLSQDDAALLSGMILGDTSGMSPELKSAFRMCNLAHLTAVSGANVAYFLVPVSAFFQKLSGRRAVRQILIFLFLIFFGFLTGWTASVTRALFMSVGTVFSSALMKRHDPISAMFLTASILMFSNPFVCVDLGFLLSFSAALSLILFSDKMAKRLSFLPGKEYFPQAAACLVCTQLGMLPWLIALSGKQSVLLFITNLAGSFLSEGISLLCLPLAACLLAAQVIPYFLPVVRILYLPLGGLLFILAKMAVLCSGQSIRALRLYSVEPVLLFSISVFILTFLIPKGFVTRSLRRIMCIVLSVGIVMQIYSYINRPMCTVLFTDVGQGDSALILLDNNMSILIDGGDIGSAEKVLIPVLNYYGIEEPDITILTHLHSDHGSGIIEMIEAGRIDTVFTPCIIQNDELTGLFSLESDNRLTLHSLEKGDKIVLSEDAALYVLSPESITMEGGNEDSAVILLCIGDTGVLFMGDAGESTEELMLDCPQTMTMLENQAEFIKIGHHGSKFASTWNFLSALSLRAAIISVGENSYGHPTDDTLKRLAENNIDIYRTDYSGAVILEIQDNASRIYEYSS